MKKTNKLKEKDGHTYVPKEKLNETLQILVSKVVNKECNEIRSETYQIFSKRVLVPIIFPYIELVSPAIIAQVPDPMLLANDQEIQSHKTP